MSELEETVTFICNNCHSDVSADVISGKALMKIKTLERQLDEARYYATDYAMKLGKANEKLEEVREELEQLKEKGDEV